ncbi:tRNA lysidine(34) synthetase TilS [Piscirickettsia litoralis]|uniref:tRNA(Ile)-lysidine synthase n=1 Tax=Piscirickettsia litoralis TaxID=1891921 RepID=A0ABX3A882_9GAMM|nr:tRNA lysidine(34) synthetase TilS [Piscirickettsia litoralis]ODN43645.1 tRNA lysidine(34) synthetase TilS [Piscirickettsia litoralis]
MEPLKHKTDQATSPIAANAVIRAMNICLPRLILARHLYLGLSGGIDSRVLLTAFIQLSARYPKHTLTDKLTVVHIHHGLNKKADGWAMHCQKLCEQYGIHFICEKVSLTDFSLGVEAAARKARYAVFQNLMTQNDVLLLGQHSDDQVETVLLQLFRGAGPRGLAAMAKEMSFGDDGLLLRPFLKITQADIDHYARDYKLDWLHDDSNDDLKFERNFLRHQILPKLNQRYPALHETVRRSARLCAEQEALLADYLEQDLKKHGVTGNSSLDLCFDLTGFNHYSVIRQKALLRAWLSSCQVLMPSEVKLEHMLTDVCAAKIDAEPEIKWGNWSLRRYRHQLYLLDQIKLDAMNNANINMQDQPWQGEKLTLKSGQVISNQDLIHLGVNLGDWDWQGVTIGYRQGGERFHPQGRNHSQPLKKFLQECHIPPWQRNKLILVKRDQKVLAILGIALAAL